MNFLKKTIFVGLSTLMVVGMANADIITEVDLKLTYKVPAVNAKFGNTTGNWYANYFLQSMDSDVELLSNTAFCVENAAGIGGTSKYDIISLDELDADFAVKYIKAASIAEGFINNQYSQTAAQVAIWETVLGSDFTLYSTVTDYNKALSATNNDVSYWSIAVSPTGDFKNGRFTEGLIGQNYLVRTGPPTSVPEPLTISLLGLSLLGLAGFSRRKRS